MKIWIRGRSVLFREVTLNDAPFILKIRQDPELGQYLSPTPAGEEKQREFIRAYFEKENEFYFIIMDPAKNPIGTIRIYDIQGDSFCWGSWILIPGAPQRASVESIFRLFDFAFNSLGYKKSHFDVRKKNLRVATFYKRMGAIITSEDHVNLYLEYTRETHWKTRKKYLRVLN